MHSELWSIGQSKWEWCNEMRSNSSLITDRSKSSRKLRGNKVVAMEWSPFWKGWLSFCISLSQISSQSNNGVWSWKMWGQVEWFSWQEHCLQHFHRGSICSQVFFIKIQLKRSYLIGEVATSQTSSTRYAILGNSGMRACAWVFHLASQMLISGCVYTYPDGSEYPDVSAPDRPSVYTKTIEVYAIRSYTLRYLELFENDFKGGSSGYPGALRTRVNGASGYPDVTAHALCALLLLEFLLKAVFYSFRKLQNFLSLFSCPVTAVFHITSSILKAISHALTGPIFSRSMPSNAVFYSR